MSTRSTMKDLQTLGDYKKELARAKKEIKALNKVIDQLVLSPPPQPTNAPTFEITDEELIYDMQIVRIKEASMQRDLTLEEAKRLELLGKIKKLAKEDRAIEVKSTSDTDLLSESQLLQIAGNSDE